MTDVKRNLDAFPRFAGLFANEGQLIQSTRNPRVLAPFPPLSATARVIIRTTHVHIYIACPVITLLMDGVGHAYVATISNSSNLRWAVRLKYSRKPRTLSR